MANPTDTLPALAIPGLPPTINPIPKVQPNLPALAQQTPQNLQPPVVVPPAVNGFVPRGPTPYGVPGGPAVAPVTPAAPAAAVPAAAPAAAAAATTSADPTLAARMADVPDGGRLVNLPSAGTPPVANSMPVAATPITAGLQNPSSTISGGYERQQAYAQNFLDQALNYIQGGGDIFERATRGRAIGGILHAVAGQNNEGSAQAQGANGLNSAVAGIANAGTMAGAQMYGSDNSLAARQAEIGEQHYQYQNTPRAVGSDIVQTPFGPMPAPRYALPVGGMVGQPLSPTTPPAAKPSIVEGSTGVRNGKPVVYRNGQWDDQK
jgi:hypothetical protein